LHRVGTARQPVNGLATCENPEGEHLRVAQGGNCPSARQWFGNPEGEHLIVAKGRSSPSDSPFLAPLSKHCGMVKSFVQMELYVE